MILWPLWPDNRSNGRAGVAHASLALLDGHHALTPSGSHQGHPGPWFAEFTAGLCAQLAFLSEYSSDPPSLGSTS